MNISQRDSVVTLAISVTNYLEKVAAERAAGAVLGVAQVADELTIGT